MIIENFETEAEKTLHEADAYRVPVPIQIVAQHLNLELEAFPLGDISGMLVVRGNQGAIGYNSAHSRTRQRLTISHEIAHFILHARRNGQPQLFIDQHIMFCVDEGASAKADREELEAAWFSSTLLLPKRLVLKEIQTGDLNLDDDEAIDLLAKQFWVSPVAMANRLLRLGILGYPANH